MIKGILVATALLTLFLTMAVSVVGAVMLITWGIAAFIWVMFLWGGALVAAFVGMAVVIACIGAAAVGCQSLMRYYKGAKS